MQAAPGEGVISSAVLMSDTADEVDWEWSGNNYKFGRPNVQTNYFGKGITANYDRSTTEYTDFEMTTGFHKYSIDWTADSLTWSIDDKAVRTLYRKDCDNGEHQYPQTPSRFHLGVWVAGDPDNAPGVIQWSGGPTDFEKLPYTAYVKSVNLEPASKCAYFNYTDKRGASDSVKCLSELPQSLSSVISSTALNTLSAAPPAPSTTSNVISSPGTSSSSPGISSSQSTQASGSSSSSSGPTGGTTSTINAASSQSTQASGSSGPVQLTTSTVFRTTVFSTVTSCNTAVTNCPAGKPLTSTVLVTDVVVDYTTVCPVTTGKAPSSTRKRPSKVPKPASSTTVRQTTLPPLPVAQNAAPPPASSSTAPSVTPSNGPLASSNGPSSSTTPAKAKPKFEPWRRPASQQPSGAAPAQVTVSSDGPSGTAPGLQPEQDRGPSGDPATGSTNPPELTTSTVYNTNIYTVTSCASDVENCPASSTVLSTEVVVAYTTVCPVSSDTPSESLVPSAGIPSEPRPSDDVPPFKPPKDGSQQQSSEAAAPGSPSAPGPSDVPPAPSSPTLIPPKAGAEKQLEEPASSINPSAPAPSGVAPVSSPTIMPPDDAHEVPPSGSPTGSDAATTSMEYGQSSASLYNTDMEVKALDASTPPAALPTVKGGDTPAVAQNHAIPGQDSSPAEEEHGSAAPPSEKGQSPPEATPGPDGPAPSSTDLAHPVPAGGEDEGASTTRSTITRTKTVRLTSTRLSTSTFYSASATVITTCAPGQSGDDCSTISSTTTFVVSKLVTPVPFTTTDVYATTETIDVAPADSGLSAAAQGVPGVAGAGTGTGQHPAGAKTTTPATIAGAGRAFEVVVPGVLLALAVCAVFL